MKNEQCDFVEEKLYINLEHGGTKSGRELNHENANSDCWIELAECVEEHTEQRDIYDPTATYVNIITGETTLGEGLNKFGFTSSDWVLEGDNSKGKKFDYNKPDWSLVPARELEDIVKVFTMGMQKYGRENWKGVEDGMFRYYAAAKRHLNWYKLYMETGDAELMIDGESGLHHLAHAATNLIFLMWLDNNNAHNFSEENIPDWVLNKKPVETEHVTVGFNTETNELIEVPTEKFER